MKRKQFVKDYLTFNRKDRTGLLILVVMLVILLLVPRLYDNATHFQTSADTAWLAKMELLIKDSLAKNTGNTENYTGSQTEPPTEGYFTGNKATLFYFDPNTLPAEGWEKLGLRFRTVKTIINYRNKGGRFKKPEDLSKIYGLSSPDYLRLLPYVVIEHTEPPETRSSPEENKRIAHEAPPKKTMAPAYIDVNTADTAIFIRLSGIGSKLALRIVKFRDALGGFYSVDQIKETYALPDSTYQKIKPYLRVENPSLKKININTATLEELKGHPYIRTQIAKPLIAYRNEHGAFKSLEELKNIQVINRELFDKLTPYLKTE